MRLRVSSGHWAAVSRIALVGLIGSAAAACSTDSARFSENPFSNPFAASERMDTGASTPSQPQASPSYAAAPMPTPSVQAQALPPVQSQPSRIASAPAPIQPRPAPAVQTASAQPAAQPKFRLVDTSKVPAATTPVAAAEPAKRVRPGMTATAQAPAPVALAPAKSAPMQVASAVDEPLVSAPKPLASAPKPVVEQPKVAALTQPEPVKPVAVQPAAPAPAPQPEAAKAPAPEPEQTASVSGDFRWPARGRVIAGFGANGGNEGINIAVPEGTPVKAAEAGVVTYAGSEVKGYGNLILVKHENGYVSAYAHNGSINVKRGEQVKRGQVIATSGQTGNVTSPQLHFEIRKGATPVDPMKYLGG
jgi:murein DD-endopeptidase MepM/ murein hydrolase activator NlpD